MKLRLFILSMLVGLFSACAIKQSPIEIDYWRVLPERSGPPRTNQLKYWITQGTISVTSPFDTKSFVYRLDEQKYEKDFYNEYITMPSEMLASATRQWLNAAGVFEFAVNNGNTLMPLYLLQGVVDEMYTDFRKDQTPAVVFTIEYYLSTTDGIKKNNVIFRKKYTLRENISDNTAKSIVKAQQTVITKAFTQFEDDLSREASHFPKP
jgi:hypothetical protein